MNTNADLFKTPPPKDVDAVAKTRAYLERWAKKHGAYTVPTRDMLQQLLHLADAGKAIVVVNVMDTAKLSMNRDLRAWFGRLAVRFHRSNHFPSRGLPVLFVAVSTTEFNNPGDENDDGYTFVETCFKPRVVPTVLPYFSNAIYAGCGATWACKPRVQEVNGAAGTKVLEMSMEPITQIDVMALIAHVSPVSADDVRPYAIEDLRQAWVRQGFNGALSPPPTHVSEVDTLVDAAQAHEKDTLAATGERFAYQYAALARVDARHELTRFLPPSIRAVVYVTLQYGVLPAAGLPLFRGIWNPEDLPDAVLRRILGSAVLSRCVLVLPVDVMDTPNVPAVSGLRIDIDRRDTPPCFLYGDVAELLDELEEAEEGAAAGDGDYNHNQPYGQRRRRRAASHVDVATTPLEKWRRRLSGSVDPYVDVAHLAMLVGLQAKAWHAGRVLRGVHGSARAGHDSSDTLPFAMSGYERCVLTGPPTAQYMFRTKSGSELAMVNLALMRCNIASILVESGRPDSHLKAVQAAVAYMVGRNLVSDPFRYAFFDAVAAGTNLVEALLTVVCSDPNDVQVFYQIYGAVAVLHGSDAVDTTALQLQAVARRGRLTDVMPYNTSFWPPILVRHSKWLANGSGGRKNHGLGSGLGMALDVNPDVNPEPSLDGLSWFPLNVKDGVKTPHVALKIKRGGTGKKKKTVAAHPYVPAPAWMGRSTEVWQPAALPSYCVNEHSRMAYTFGANVTANHAYPCVFVGERRVGNTQITIERGWACVDDVALPLFFAVTRYETQIKPVYTDRQKLGTFYAIAGPGPRCVDVLLALRPPQLALSRAQRRLFTTRSATAEDVYVLTRAQAMFERWRRVIQHYVATPRDHKAHVDVPGEVVLAHLANAATPAEFVKLALNKEHYLPPSVVHARAHGPHGGGRQRQRRDEPLPPSSTSKPFLVYGAPWCPWTQKALAAIGTNNCTFVEVANADEAKAIVQKTHADFDVVAPAKHTTIPLVFEGSTFIGGATETLARLEHVKDPSQWSLTTPQRRL